MIRLMFHTSLSDFLKARDAKDPSYLDWTSNDCSFAPDQPLGFDFRPACKRHDFGYQNFRPTNLWTSELRLEVDVNFQNDMFVDVCNCPLKYHYPTLL